MHPFRDDRRSKSIEEREEEYQRVRERIFAHDVSSCFNCLLSMGPSISRKAPPFSERAGREDRGRDQERVTKQKTAMFPGKNLAQGCGANRPRVCVCSQG